MSLSDTQSSVKEESTEAVSGSTGEKIKIEFWYAWGDKIDETNEEQARRFNESQEIDGLIVRFRDRGSFLKSKPYPILHKLGLPGQAVRISSRL